MNEADAVGAATALRTRLSDIVRELSDALISTEPLAEFVPAKRVALVFWRESRLVEVARVWRLGVLLIDTDGALYTAGETTRAVDPGWPQHQAQSAEVRREYRAAAMRSRFAAGKTININATPVVTTVEGLMDAEGPVFLHDNLIRVRWSSRVSDDAAILIDDYLSERVELLLHRPEGA